MATLSVLQWLSISQWLQVNSNALLKTEMYYSSIILSTAWQLPTDSPLEKKFYEIFDDVIVV